MAGIVAVAQKAFLLMSLQVSALDVIISSVSYFVLFLDNMALQ